MSAEVDVLQVVPDADLPNLRDVFRPHWPHALHAYHWLNNYIDWKHRQISNCTFYCPDGRWDDGTFITVDKRGAFTTVFVFTLEPSCERLRAALARTNTINWADSNPIFFLAVHEAHRPTVEAELARRSIPIESRDVANMWWIPKEEAALYEYTVPEEVYVSALRLQDAATMDAVWPHRGAASLQYIETLITANGGFGLYLKKDGTLCSWVVKNDYGGIALLQTAAQHTRKGYATVLAKHFSKYWAQRGIDIFGFIMVHNTASLRLFEKIGYRREHGITWIHCKRKF